VGGISVPKTSFLRTCESLGAVNGKKRWRSLDSTRLYEWDSLHGEIEVYNKRGDHLGVLDSDGVFIKNAIKGRTIDV
jgi:hypothetical protein